MAIRKGRKKGTWRVRLHHKGQEIERIFEGKKADAEEYEAQLRAQLRAEQPVERRGSPTLTAYCRDDYAPSAKLRLKASSWSRQRSHLKQLLAELGDVKLSAFTSALVEAYQRQRLEDGLNATSVNNETRALNRVLNHARSTGLTVAPQTWGYLSEPPRAVRAYTRLQVRVLLHACRRHSPTIYEMVRCMVLTGMRRGEVMALPLEHVDFERRIIRVWSVEEGGRVAWSPKAERSREIPLPTELEAYLRAQAAAGRRWAYPSRTGRRRVEWSKNQWARAVSRANAILARLDRERLAAGLPGRYAPIQGGPHRLRHTYASWYLEVRPDLPRLSRLLGHSISKTTELYAHLLPEHLAGDRDVVSLSPAPENVVELQPTTSGEGPRQGERGGNR